MATRPSCGNDETEPAAARSRAGRIGSFRAELAELRCAGVLRLEARDQAAVDRYHDGILGELAESGELDPAEGGAHLALGLRVVSLIGTLAFGASVFYFFYRIWGVMAPALQVSAVAAAPMLALGATAAIARREPTRYFTTLAGLFALASLIVNVVMLHAAFNLSPSVLSLFACGLFAVTLAYGYGLNLLLVLGVSTLAWGLAGSFNLWTGRHWANALERPETFLPAGVLLLAAGVAGAVGRPSSFPPIYRVTGIVFVLLPIVLLASMGWLSFLPWDPEPVETTYQVLGFVLGAVGIWLGISRRWKDVVYASSLFFIVLLYLKFVDWWWAWMPRYLFFLVVALTAVASGLLLRRLSGLARSAPGRREA